MSLRSFTQSPTGPSVKHSSQTQDRRCRDYSHPSTAKTPLDFVVFSHLRWDFVFQRPQHLLTRCAAFHRVFFVEEPVFDIPSTDPYLEVRQKGGNLSIAIPHLPYGMSGEAITSNLRKLTDALISGSGISNFVCWYYTPMALPFTQHLKPSALIYDCMDELSLFQGAPPSLLELERQLFGQADVVFTGGKTLFEHKKAYHSNIHPFPSSIDVPHFAMARDRDLAEASDQSKITGPKIGYFGVIDERMDLELLAGIALARPEWNLIMVGPIVKIDADTLPRASNIHYLGSRTYDELPSYIKGWDVAILPFARNDSTKFISPTKTPEYLAAGVPVVSTSIRDVVTPYGELGLALVADEVLDFVRAIEFQLARTPACAVQWLQEVDAFLAGISWDRTWKQMRDLITRATEAGGSETGVGRITAQFATSLPRPVRNQKLAV